ncbi:hypothetical protein [Mycobacterium sp. SMC-4]|uniref:hypothetical protein n=1 Tax=Mycobacterium sp. SMC-4 TaxID=2857059 RepID=UPI003D021C24
MGWDKYVGRVGALAVALGIGSAVAAVPGLAGASTEGASSTGTSGSSASSSTRAANDAESRTRSKTSKEVAGPRKKSIAEDSPRRTSGTGKRAAATTTPETKSIEGDESADLTSELVTPDENAAADPTPAPSPAEPLPADPPAAEPSTDPVVEQSEQTSPPATVSTPLSSPRAVSRQSNGPGSPAASPLLFTAVTSARRHLGERTSEFSSAAARSAAQAGAQAAAAAASIPGNASSPVVIGADGTRYQVTWSGDVTRVSILDSDGQVVTTSEDIPGSGAVRVTRPDGTLIVITRNASRSRSTISAVDSEGNVSRLATFTGLAEGTPMVGADGALYMRTQVLNFFDPFSAPIDYRLVRVSPANTVRSFSYDAELELAPDGTAYMVSSVFGFSTLRVFNPNGGTRAIGLPFGTDPSGPILGEDGNAYVTVGIRGWFGSKTTRVYTVGEGARTVRTIRGLPGETVVSPDGFYLETFNYSGSTDNQTGTTTISRITATTIDTSDTIGARISGFQVTPDGTVYAAINPASSETASVAVIDRDGVVATTELPGALVLGQGINLVGGGATAADDFGYFVYVVDGREYVAVLNPDATVNRMIELPLGTEGAQVFFGPDGAAYVSLRYRIPEGNYTDEQILALSTDTYTPIVPGSGYVPTPQWGPLIEFGPNGEGYLITGGDTQLGVEVLGFNAAGEVVGSASGLTVARALSIGPDDQRVLMFDPAGNAYLTVFGPDHSGVYVLTPAGAEEVLDLEYQSLRSVQPPTFDADGTGFVTMSGVVLADGSRTTLVFTFPSLAAG